MTTASHVIETDGFSRSKPEDVMRARRLRRLILIGLAAAMALATLAPVVVLAGA
jgi:hypothetical protein